MTSFLKIVTFYIFLISCDIACGQNTSSPTTVSAQFPGGKDSLKVFLKKNFTYDKYVPFCSYPVTIKAAIQVLKDGTIKFIDYIGPNDNTSRFEAIRTIDKMPKWVPANENGQPIVSTVTVTLYSK